MAINKAAHAHNLVAAPAVSASAPVILSPVLVLLWLLSAAVAAQDSHPFVRTAVLTGDFSDLPPQAGPNDLGPAFGLSVAMDGDWLAVGAPFTSFHGDAFGIDYHGAVFLFKRTGSGWNYMQRILHPAWGPSFCGWSVALAVPHLVVGCQRADEITNPSTNAGIVRWYRLDDTEKNWQLDSGYHGPPSALCGSSVAISPIGADGGTVLAIGCPGDNGFVVTYSYSAATNTWSAPQYVTASDAAIGDRFGESVSVHRAVVTSPIPIVVRQLAVGAPNKYQGGSIFSGAAYVFSGSNWTETDIFTHPGAQSIDQTYFGNAVAINAGQLIIGSRGGAAIGCMDPPPRCGLVRRYERDAGTWEFKGGAGAVNAAGNPPGMQLGMAFSHAVALGDGGWVAVSAPETDGWRANATLAEDVGLVELRRGDDGQYGVLLEDHRGGLRPEPLPQDRLSGGRFGMGLDFGTDSLAVGYPLAGTLAGRFGEVWVYEVSDALFSDRFEQ